MPLVNYEVKGHVAIVTLNRPDARNAINPEVAVRLADAWTAARDDDNVRVIVVTGNGSAFCAGADLGQLIPMMSGARKPENEFDHRVIKEPGITSRALLRNFDTEKPVIAAINGHAIAGGMEMVQGTDIRVSCPCGGPSSGASSWPAWRRPTTRRAWPGPGRPWGPSSPSCCCVAGDRRQAGGSGAGTGHRLPEAVSCGLSGCAGLGGTGRGRPGTARARACGPLLVAGLVGAVLWLPVAPVFLAQSRLVAGHYWIPRPTLDSALTVLLDAGVGSLPLPRHVQISDPLTLGRPADAIPALLALPRLEPWRQASLLVAEAGPQVLLYVGAFLLPGAGRRRPAAGAGGAWRCPWPWWPCRCWPCCW